MPTKIITIIIFFAIFTCGCAQNKSGTFVNNDNIFYSDKNPKIKIKIDSKYRYSPGHHIAIKHKSEFFLNEDNNESVFIRTYKGDFSPKDTFFGKKMFNSEQKTILGATYYVGTEIAEDSGDYFLRRVFITYPNNRTMFLVMCTTPLYNEYQWADIKKLNEKQIELIHRIIEQSDRRIEFLNY